MLYPLQRALLMPVEALGGGRDYLGGLARAIAAEEAARSELARQSRARAAHRAAAAENARLRALLELRADAHRALAGGRDPVRGARSVLAQGRSSTAASRTASSLGSPVINEAGVLGQVTRVYLLSAEVTLLTDKDAAIPVLNSAHRARSAAFGGAAGGPGLLEMRFMAGNADVQVGDVLTTSGVDGVYPPGLPVAKVARSTARSTPASPASCSRRPAPADGVRHVLVLEPIRQCSLPPRPQAGGRRKRQRRARPPARRATRK